MTQPPAYISAPSQLNDWRNLNGKPFVTVSTNNTTASGADFGPDSLAIDGSGRLSTTGGQTEANNYLFSIGGGVAVLIDNQPLTIAPSSINIFCAASALTGQWAQFGGKPYLTVSPIGITSGNYIKNNGADYGPDTLGTITSGIQEAHNVLSTGEVRLLPGQFTLGGPVSWITSGVHLVGSGVGATILSPSTSFVIPPGALNGHGGLIELTGFSAGATLQDVTIRGLSFDLTGASSNVSAIHQGFAPMQNIEISDFTVNAPGASYSIQLEALGAQGGESFNVNVRNGYTRNGAGIVYLLNATATSSTYHDCTIENIVSRVDINGILDDRVAFAGNFSLGSGSNRAEVYGCVMRNIQVTIAASVTSGLINGVKLDPGASTLLHEMEVSGVYYHNASSVSLGQPAIFDGGTGNSYIWNWSIQTVRATGPCLRFYFVAGQFDGNSVCSVKDVTANNLTDPIAGMEIDPLTSPNSDILIIDGVALHGPTTAAGSNIPVGIMLTRNAGAGVDQTRISNVKLNNFQWAISDAIDESGTVYISTGWNIERLTDIPLLSGYAGQIKLVSPNATVSRIQGLSPVGFGTPNPAVPASGTAQANSNPYNVYAYIYGGAVSVIKINTTTVYSGSAIAFTGVPFGLSPGDTITLTYTTAPTWAWYGL